MTDRLDEIRKRILTILMRENIEVGEKIWSEDRLASELEENKSTIHRVLKVLDGLGIVMCRRGGTILNREISPDDFAFSGKNKSKVYVLYTDDEKHEAVHWGVPALRGLEETLNAKERVLLYKQVDKRIDETEFLALIDEIESDAPEAMIFSLVGNGVKWLSKFSVRQPDFNIPIYVHEHALGEGVSTFYNSVSLDSFRDGQMIGRLVEENTMGDVYFLQEKSKVPKGWARLRFEGIKSVLAGRKLRKYEEPVALIKFLGEQAPRKDLKKGTKTHHCRRSSFSKKTVVIALNNKVAAGFIDEAEKNGLNCPGDYFLISFDDYSKYYRYNISSLKPPLEKIGELLGKLVCKNSSAKNGSTLVNLKVCSTFVERRTFPVTK